MFGRLTNMLKRVEMATDMMVLEKAPDSPRAEQIRERYRMQNVDRSIQFEINKDVERIEAKIKADRDES